MKSFAEKMNLKRLVTLVMALALVVGTVPANLATTVHAAGNKTVVFDIKDADGNAVTDATITLTEYDSYEDEETDVEPEADGSYKVWAFDELTWRVSKGGITKDGKVTVKTSDPDPYTIEVVLAEESADMKRLKAIKEIFDKEYNLKPAFATDKNVNDVVLNRIKTYSGVDTTGVSVSLVSSDETSWVKEDGTIVYNKGTLSSWGMNSKNVSCAFKLSAGSDSVETGKKTVIVGFDIDNVNEQIKKEMESLTFNTIKGDNESADEITKDLTLPQITASSARQSWSKIVWTSSNPAVISIEKTGYDGLTDPKKAVVTAPSEDTKVTLTATFGINDTIINDNVEKPKDFGSYTKEFEVTVKGSGAPVITEEYLQDLIHTYYLTDNDKAKALGYKPYKNLTNFTDATKPLDLNAVADDIQLPRYTKLKDENNELVFENKEISVVYEGTDKLLSVSGYKLNVDRSADVDKKAKFKVSMTRGGVTGSVEVEMTIKSALQSEIDDEIALMELAKANYWNAINDSICESKDKVQGVRLHPFCEIGKDKDGNLKVYYYRNEAPGTGIVLDDFFDPGDLSFETAGYNHFKSSNPNVIAHETLNITKPEYDTEVTITSLLCSAKLKDMAAKHPENEKLQKLVKQEVSVTVTVLGEKGPKPSTPPVEKHADITVFFTVSNKGVLAKANDGTFMAQREVVASDINEDGAITVDEVLVAAHAKYNTADGYVCGGGLVKKLWGTETTNALFFKNNKGLATGVTADTVEDKDYVTASVNKDANYYSDWITYIKAEGEIGLNKEITLTLMGHLGMGYTAEETTDKPIPGATIKTADGTVLGVTDANGQIKVKFDKVGSYVLTAEGTAKGVVTDWNLMKCASSGDKVAFGKMDMSTYVTEIGYTEADYGDGPYPVSEIKWFTYMDEDYETYDGWEKLHFLTSNQLLNDCPLIAPAYTLTITENGGSGSDVNPDNPNPDDKAVVVSDEKLGEIFANTAKNLTGTATTAAGAGSIYGAEWTVMGLSRNGNVNEDLAKKYYGSVETYVKKNIKEGEVLNTAAPTENARVIIALTSLGFDPTNVAGHNLVAGLNSMGRLRSQGLNALIWALIAVDSGNYEIPANVNTNDAVTREALVKAILGAELTNGGFAIQGTTADPDMTAMAIQALAPYKNQADVKAVIDRAVTVLSKMQNANGGFSTEYTGDSAESIAQVIVALTSIGIDPKTDARFVKDGISLLDSLARFATANGGFKHISAGIADGIATEQSFYALVAYNRFKEGKNSLYNMSDVTKKENPIVENTEPVQLEVPKINDALTDVSIAEDKIDEAIAAGVVPEKQLVKIDMSNSDGSMATVAPVAVLEEVKGKDIDVVLDMGDYSWTINGNDITAENLQAINLEVKEVKDKVPAGVVASLVGDDETAIQLELTHNGDFGFKATLKYFFGKENEGKYVNIFWYKEDGTTEFIDSGLVGADGFAELTFTHASEYVAVISNVDKKEAVLDTEINNNEPVKSAQTGDTFAGSIVVSSMILCMLIGMAAVMYIRRKEER